MPVKVPTFAMVAVTLLLAGSLGAETTHHEGLRGGSQIPRVRLTFNNEEMLVKMLDNQTTRHFISLLPLTLTWRDYNATEKVGDLPQRLATAGAPAGIKPVAGDFAYYAPWGNLAIFYKDSGYADGLISLGKVESGMEKLLSAGESFTVIIEKID